MSLRYQLCRIVLLSVSLFCTCFSGGVLRAGGGAENLVLVVNADSWASKMIANEYIALRELPENRIVYLSNLGSFETINVDDFRDKILKPVIATIQQRGLGTETDYIAYSSDFPTAINVKGDIGKTRLPRMITPVASINGLTYLYQQALSGNPEYLRLDSNRYIRLPIEKRKVTPPTEADQKQYMAAQQLLQKQQWDEAAKILEVLAKKYPDRPDTAYNLACCYARQEKTGQALAALELAIRRGWSNRSHTQKDDDLQSLRENEQFQALLQKMEKQENQLVEVQDTLGFRSQYQWDRNGTKVSGGGVGYLLSCMLAVTSGRGNSVNEAIASLRKSVQADQTQPDGTIYYVRNSNVRSTTRERLFASAVATLMQLGVKAEIVDGILPDQKDDVAGAMIGTARFDWLKSKSKILPGAICEHLTSFGGIMREEASQTPLTEFIRHGAAGSSGTVTEPFAIQAKFPLAFIHTHYARGCSLAEAFYQSVRGPYQLLVVGDPLCQPWAKAPQFKVRGLQANEEVKGTIVLQPQTNSNAVKVREYRLYLDGRRIDTCRPGEQFSLATEGMPEGWHEARIVAIADNSIETQSRTKLPFHINNRGQQVKLSSPDGNDLNHNDKLKLKAVAEDAETITFLHNLRPFERIQGGDGIVEVDPKLFGCGPVTIRAVAIIQKRPVFSNPLTINIQPPKPIKGKEIIVESWADGLLLKNEKQRPVVVTDTKDRDWLRKQLNNRIGAFQLEGYFAADADLYQFQFRGNAIEEILVDKTSIWKAKDENNDENRWQFVPVALTEGQHHLEIRGRSNSQSNLEIRFGNRGAQRLSSKRFQHPKSDEPESKTNQ